MINLSRIRVDYICSPNTQTIFNYSFYNLWLKSMLCQPVILRHQFSANMITNTYLVQMDHSGHFL